MTPPRTTSLVNRLGKKLGGLLRGALFSFMLEVEPVPASRPRVSQWGTYYSKAYTKFRKEAEVELRSLPSGEPTDEPLFVVTEVICTKPRTGKLSHPKGDIDNYEKSIFDAITKAEKYWRDDRQIVGAMTVKRYAAPGEQSGYHVTAYAIKEQA